MEYGIEEPQPFGANLPKDKIQELKELFEDFKAEKMNWKNLKKN